MEGLGDALVAGSENRPSKEGGNNATQTNSSTQPALPLEELAGRPRRVGRAEPLVGAVAAVVVGVAPPGLEDAPLVVTLELVWLTPVGT